MISASMSPVTVRSINDLVALKDPVMSPISVSISTCLPLIGGTEKLPSVRSEKEPNVMFVADGSKMRERGDGESIFREGTLRFEDGMVR